MIDDKLSERKKSEEKNIAHIMKEKNINIDQEKKLIKEECIAADRNNTFYKVKEDFRRKMT